MEIQALFAPAGAGSPRRAQRDRREPVLMLIAVLARHAGVNLTSHDVYVNVAGGLRIEEPAADLAVGLAFASSLREGPVRCGTVSRARSPWPEGCAPRYAPSAGWRRRGGSASNR